MNERGKSDGGVVPAKPANKAATAVAEPVEERHPAKGNTDGETHPGRRAGNGVSRDLDGTVKLIGGLGDSGLSFACFA